MVRSVRHGPDVHLTRRALLQAGAAMALSRAARAGEGSMTQRESVAVVGAGVSGLACAAELRRLGLEVVVLEGRDRIGGRVWSDESLGFPADMGASWVEGHESNPIAPLVRAGGGELVPTDFDSVAVFRGGKRVPDGALEDLAGAYEELLGEVEHLAEGLEEDVSFGDAIERVLRGERLSRDEREGLDFLLAASSLAAAADMGELGLAGSEEDEGFDGEDALVRGGYGLFPRHLARGLDVRTGHTVRRITHGRTGVKIETTKGAFEASRCVLSLPLGVLKAGSVTFAPALSDAKQNAIRRMGMGVLDKVALALPRRVIPEDFQFIGRIGDRPGRYPVFLDLERLTGRPGVLGFISAADARAAEKRSDREVVAMAMASLREALGAKVPEPTGAVVVRWAGDPFARGSYSHVAVGARAADMDALAAPEGERLYFCGEATMRGYSATVHGAYLSGLREAARIGGSTPPGVKTTRRRSRRRAGVQLSRKRRT